GGFDECAPPGGNTRFGGGLCSDQNKDPMTGVPYPSHAVDAYVAFDLQASYTLQSSGGPTSFSVGVPNLLAAAPPAGRDSFLSYADPTYDLVGRYLYGRISHRF